MSHYTTFQLINKKGDTNSPAAFPCAKRRTRYANWGKRKYRISSQYYLPIKEHIKGADHIN
jgi:hypothetical protein